MKVSLVVLGVVVACVAAFAAEHGPLLTALQPQEQPEYQLVEVHPANDREKRSLLLVGAGLLGAGVLGAGLVGAGVLGAGVIGAKAGLVGGVLASKALYHERGYGGYGGGWSYGGYGSYGGYKSPSSYSSYGYSSW